MKKGFSIVDQGKGPQSPAPSPGPHPRSGERISYLGKTLTESGTYNGGRSEPLPGLQLTWRTIGRRQLIRPSKGEMIDNVVDGRPSRAEIPAIR